MKPHLSSFHPRSAMNTRVAHSALHSTTDISTVTPTAPAKLQAGSAAWRRATLAIFFGGFASFAMLYGMQPLMPAFAMEFDLVPAAASGIMSVAAGLLALCLIPASLLADRHGRKAVMVASLAASGLLMLVVASLHGYTELLWTRSLFGVALAGLPAVAMTYLAEEIDAASLGRSVGLYIAGNAVGGLSGRLISPVLADYGSWRLAAALLGLLGVLAAVAVLRTLPAPAHSSPRHSTLRDLLPQAMTHLRDAGLPWLFLIGFLLMGCFSSYYNYLGFRLAAPPFSLPLAAQGLVFLPYLFGIFSSAWAGGLADRFGRRRVLWIMVGVMGTGFALSLSHSSLVLGLGVILVTFGFFAAHSVTSSWVGRRAKDHRALASAIYLTGYYLGASVLGSATGLIWQWGAWYGLMAVLGAVLLLCMLIALKLRGLVPQPG